MGDFKKFGKKGGDTWNRGPGGRPSFNSRPGFNRGGDERREMFKATCAECGKPCEVPFRPSGDRPVYCKDCFAAMGPQDRDDSRGPSRGPSNFQRRDSAPRQNFAPRPSFTPVQGSGEDKRLDDIKIQLATAISKLDKLINLMVNNAAHTTPAGDTRATLKETIESAVPKAVADKQKKSKKKASKRSK